MRRGFLSGLGLLCSSLALCLLMAAGAAATSWDATADFSITNGNPNGVWSYGYYPNGTTSFTLFWHAGTGYAGSPLWNNSNDDQPPVVWKNIGSPQWGVQTGELSLHPGPSNEHTVVRWTSPINGTINITGKFGAGDKEWMNYYIQKNVTEEVLFEVKHTYNDGAFDLLNVPVTVGDTIDFIVGGQYLNGNTPLYATITSTAVVPLPGTVWLLGAGLLVIWRSRRR